MAPALSGLVAAIDSAVEKSALDKAGGSLPARNAEQERVMASRDPGMNRQKTPPRCK